MEFEIHVLFSKWKVHPEIINISFQSSVNDVILTTCVTCRHGNHTRLTSWYAIKLVLQSAHIDFRKMLIYQMVTLKYSKKSIFSEITFLLHFICHHVWKHKPNNIAEATTLIKYKMMNQYFDLLGFSTSEILISLKIHSSVSSLWYWLLSKPDNLLHCFGQSC